MQRKFGWAATIAVTMLLPGTHVEADHSWNNFHWARAANPFTLTLGDNVSGAWDGHLDTAAADWDASAVVITSVVPGATKPRPCRPSLGRVEVCNERYGNNGWLGIAQVWIDGDHIGQAIVKVNDSYFAKAPYNTAAWRNLVMCQEVGHTLGLDHQDEDFQNANLGTCMDYSNNPATNQHPNAHDYAELEAIYAHLDTAAFVAAEALPDQAAAAAGGPESWGRLTHRSPGGRHERYELDLGHGKKVVTFVFWTDVTDR